MENIKSTRRPVTDEKLNELARLLVGANLDFLRIYVLSEKIDLCGSHISRIMKFSGITESRTSVGTRLINPNMSVFEVFENLKDGKRKYSEYKVQKNREQREMKRSK